MLEGVVMNRLSFTSLIFSAVTVLTSTAIAASLDKVQFIKIAPKDEKAVIKTADGKLQLIKPGDVIGETVTVKEIATGRIVLEEKTDRGLETVIVRMVNDKARIERLSRTPESRPVLSAPVKNEK